MEHQEGAPVLTKGEKGQDSWWEGEERVPNTREGFGKAQGQAQEGDKKRGGPTGKKTTATRTWREGRFHRKPQVSGGRQAAGVIIGHCLCPSGGVFGAVMVNSVRVGIMSVL